MEKKIDNSEIGDYIHENLRLGRRYVHIKHKLMEEGWLKEEIDSTYQQILNSQNSSPNNFQNKLMQNPGVKRASSFSNQKKPISSSRTSSNSSLFNFSSSSPAKPLVLVGFGLVLLLGVFFILNSTVGKAIYYDKLIDGSKNATSGEVTYTVQCTLPHILNPDQSGCCLDTNNNTKCDFLDTEEMNEVQKSVEKKETEQRCTNYNQCASGQCINGKCGTLTSLYSQPLDGCAKVCNFYVVDILTSDGEKYTVKPSEGSYTGAGALEWSILAAPDHCLEEPVMVPIEIVKNQPGRILSKEILTLTNGQSSKLLTHPNAKGLYFTLTVVEAQELCGNDINELHSILAKQKALKTQLQAKK
ncbi:MAG: hypothetical protein V2A62_04080 [Candidatus Woesearchaeota archaeon]